MKTYISFILLLMASRFLILSESPQRVRFASDITIIDSPQTRDSSGSDASTDLASPKIPKPRKHYPGYIPRITLTEIDMKPVRQVAEPKALYDPFTGRLDSPLSPDEFRDIKRQVAKDALAKKAPMYKRCLVWLGCTPRLWAAKVK